MKTQSTLALFALVVGFAPSVGAQTTTVLYSTDFESGLFTLGALAGQQSFVAYANKNTNSAQIVGSFPSSGSRSIQIKGANLGLYETIDPYYAGFYYRPLNYNPLTANKPRILARADVAFIENGTASSTGAGIELYQSNNSVVAGIFLGTQNAVTGFNDDYGDNTQVSGTVTPGAYHTLTMFANYTAKKTEFYVDGDALGSVAFTFNTGTDLSDLDLFYTANDVQPKADAYFDNYSVEAAASGTTLVTGRLTLEGIANPAGKVATFIFTPTSGTAFTVNTTLTANGTFTLGGIPAGTYRVLASAPQHLKLAFAVTANGTSVANLHLILLGGDIDGNNVVDVNDLFDLLAAFNTAKEDGRGLYKTYPEDDINGDGKIDVDDLTDLLFNFNIGGEQ